jgi:hypothetical protein
VEYGGLHGSVAAHVPQSLLALALIITCIIYVSGSYTHAHTQTHTHAHTGTHWHTLTHTLTLTHSLTQPPSLSLTLGLSPSYTHMLLLILSLIIISLASLARSIAF